MNHPLSHLTAPLQIAFAQRSEAGLKPENQDTIGARLPEGGLLTSKGIAIAIADGVSSSAAAKEASQMAITGFLSDYYATPETWSTQKSACQVIQSLNRYLWSLSQNNTRQEGYLTTFSLLILKGNSAFIFHVGDTRIYHLRDSELELLTRDHTQVINRKTRYLSRALGADLGLEIDMHVKELCRGDVFLLTSDGVHDFVRHAQLKEHLLQHHENMEQLTQVLLTSAKRAGSDDNISTQICRIKACGLSSQSDTMAALSSLPFPPPLEVGQKLDGLTVESILHESERSQVYLVTDKEGRKRVMKTPSPNYQEDAAYIERFVLENWIGARIQSPHVVSVVEPPGERRFLYYLTAYVQGPTLGEIIRQRAPMDIRDALELIEQVIRGVRAFHRKETLHQDLKPDNIIVSERGAVIIDFGACWVAGINELQSPFVRDEILGTRDYAAPEYHLGGTRSQRSDQFSLAVIFYELITGKKPYRSESASSIQKNKGRYYSATEANPLVPVWMDRAIEKALAINPEQRYSALSEWLQDLKRPNPQWQPQERLPLAQRNPLRFWQVVAILGWGVALTLLILSRPAP